MGEINLKNTEHNIFKFNLLSSLLYVLNHNDREDTDFIIAWYLITHLKKIKEDGARFHKELIKAMDKPPKVQNVVIHSATEDDAAKFRLYKEVCLNPYSTVIQLSEKLEIENEYALNMLLELNKVDRLIAYTFHEDTTDDDKALWYKR